MDAVQNLLAERVNVLLTSLLIFLMMLLVAWTYRYFTFPRKSDTSFQPVTGKDVFFAFAIFLCLQLLIIPLTFEAWLYLSSFGGPKMSLTTALQGWYNIYAVLLSAAGLFFYLKILPAQVQKTIWGAFAFKGWKARLQDFFIACVTWVLSYPLVVAVGQFVGITVLLLYKNVEPQQVAVQQIKLASHSQLAALILCVVLIVPVVEELLFRGFLQNWLKESMKTKYAILLTSLIFSMFHFSPSQEVGNIELIVSLFVLSCFLGFIYERQKSLWASISMHGLFNAISIVLIFIVDKE
jgi:uncharacterized protein